MPARLVPPRGAVRDGAGLRRRLGRERPTSTSPPSGPPSRRRRRCRMAGPCTTARASRPRTRTTSMSTQRSSRRYARPLPAFALAPHLAELVRSRFGRPARVVPPALERMWRPRWRWRPARRPRVVVVAPLRGRLERGARPPSRRCAGCAPAGPRSRLVRVSQWPLSATPSARSSSRTSSTAGPRPAGGGAADRRLRPAARSVVGAGGLRPAGARGNGLRGAGGGVEHPGFRGLRHRGRRAGAGRRPGRLRRRGRERSSASRRGGGEMRRAGLAAAAAFSERRVADTVEEALRWVASDAWRTGR